MKDIPKILEMLGAKGGIGLLLTLAGVGLMTSEKIDFKNIGYSLHNLPPIVIIAVLCAIIGLALLGHQILDLKSEQSSSKEDQKVLIDLVTEFASRRMLFVPLEYENIGEAVDSAKQLRDYTKKIVRGAGLTLSQTLAQRAEFYLQNFITEIDALEGTVASTADTHIRDFEEGREYAGSERTRELYQKLARPIFSTKNRLVATGSAGISLCDLNTGFALDFVRAFYRMRGGFLEILHQIEVTGVPLPQQLRTY